MKCPKTEVGKLFILDSKPMSKSLHEANSAVDDKSLELCMA